MSLYLTSTYFVDADHPDIQSYSKSVVKGSMSTEEKAIALFHDVRDQWRYNPYLLDFRPKALKASSVLGMNEGHCVGKAILLAALLRATNIESRLHFYQVQNHLGTSRLEEVLGTNVLVFHGATEVMLQGRWITITPSFNRTLCQKLGVEPLEFDGKHEAVFQAYNRENGKFMEYLHDYGPFHDLPYEYMLSEFQTSYGSVLHQMGEGRHGPLQLRGLDLLTL